VTLGTALTPTQLNATANVSGTFIYTPEAGTVLPVGLDIISVTFIPSDTADFTNATATNTILVVAPSLTPVYALNLPAINSVNWAALLNQNFVTIDNILSGATPLSGSLNAPTANALFAAPTQCLAGQAFQGIDVHGNSVGCFTPSGGGGGGLSSFTVGNLSPLFTATLGGSPLTNPALAFTLSNAAANTVFGNFTGSSAAPTFSASPVFSAANLTNFPTFNQNTTGTASNITGVLNAASEPAHTGDATNTAGSLAMTVKAINGTSLAGLATGILKNTTGTGVPSIAIASDFPTLNQNTTGNAATATNVPYSGLTGTVPTWNQNTTGSAATLTTARTIAGTSFDGSANITLPNKFIMGGTADAGLTGAQFLGNLASGLVKVFTVTGSLATAIPGTDYLLPTGSSAGLSQGSSSAFGVVKVDGTTITAASGVISAATGIANTTVTIGTTAIAANTCNTVSTVTMTGLATTSTVNFTPNADVASTTGWGGTGGLVIDAWPSSANTLSYKTCNQTASSITPGASVTFNVSAR
jgi:large repetitive protein